MARKVFISVLGAGLYGKCRYIREDENFVSDETHFVQSATMQYLHVKDWGESDLGLFLLTDYARKENWNKSIKSRHNNYSNSDVKYEGLESVIEKMHLPIKIKDLSICDGNNEKEIWDIFTCVFKVLKDNDELFFDITHAFRYLPMLILVLCNYAKFVKSVEIKSITYGNYEARDKETNCAPIINLTAISQLQDWTFAAGQYLENGSVSHLVSLCEQEFMPILRETKGGDVSARNLRDFVNKLSAVTEERKTCRGMDIIKSTSFKGLKQSADYLESTFIDAFNPIFEKIKTSLVSFDENQNISNGFEAAKWCFNNGLYQQSATILQEAVVSFICQFHDIKIDDEERRQLVNNAFAIRINNIKEDKWRVGDEENKEKVKEILSDVFFSDNNYINAFDILTMVRNDFNHSGMRSVRKPLSPSKIKEKIAGCLNAFSGLFRCCHTNC